MVMLAIIPSVATAGNPIQHPEVFERVRNKRLVLFAEDDPPLISPGETEDIRAIVSAANCGVTILATIHASDVAELQRKPLFRRLLQAKVFAKAVVIQRREGRRQYLVEDLA